jgi:hypothetical protein
MVEKTCGTPKQTWSCTTNRVFTKEHLYRKQYSLPGLGRQTFLLLGTWKRTGDLSDFLSFSGSGESKNGQ